MSKSPPRSTGRSKRSYTHGAHIYQRKGIWYAYLPERPDGVSLRTRERVEAERRFRALLADPTASANVERASPPEVTLLELADRYLDEPHGWTRRTLQTTTNRLIAFGSWCEAQGIRYPSQITEERMSAWLKQRTESVARRTLNRDLRCVRQLIAWGCDPRRTLCTPNAAVTAQKGVRESKRSKLRYVPDALEFARAVDALEEIHDGAASAVRVLYATGLRIEELRRLTPFDVRAGKIHIVPECGTVAQAEPGKSYRERSIPIAAEVVEFCKRFLSWRSGKGGKGKRVGCTESWLVKLLHRAQRKAMVPLFGLHDLRAAFATEAFDRGVGLVVIQQWMGHADPATTQGYIRPRRSDAQVVAPIPPGLVLSATSPTAESLPKVRVAEGSNGTHPFSDSSKKPK